MSFDPTTPGSPADRRIEADQIDSWAESLKTTPFRLREAVIAVGYKVSAVRKHLEDSNEAGHRSGHGSASIVPHLQKQAQVQTRPADLDAELKRNDSQWPS